MYICANDPKADSLNTRFPEDFLNFSIQFLYYLFLMAKASEQGFQSKKKLTRDENHKSRKIETPKAKANLLEKKKKTGLE